jgi:hypothetical protein
MKEYGDIRDTVDLAFDNYTLFLKAYETALGHLDLGATLNEIAWDESNAYGIYWNGVFKYVNEFMAPYWTALHSFITAEQRKIPRRSPFENIRDYLELINFNIQLAGKGIKSSAGIMNDFHLQDFYRGFHAAMSTLFKQDGEDYLSFAERQKKLLEKVVYEYDDAIRNIEEEYGFHFDSGGYARAAETDRFIMYEVFPNEPGIKTDSRAKPILILPPYVLGENILAFLPAEKRSYVHAFANQGIPTYVRVVKDINTTPAVQCMIPEEDALDTRYFCEILKKKHGLPVTLNGFCQGGLIALVDLLSGEFKGLVDALITCVAPIDGTRSKSLVEYLKHQPDRFRDISYAVKDLPNGNRVVDGKIMSWVYRLMNVEREAPLYSFYRDLMMFDDPHGKDVKITKTAAAINHWLIYDRRDMPVSITKMSFDSYTVPITKDGTLPIRLFGKRLNLRTLKDAGMKFLICCGLKDDLVDKESALAPLDYVDAEVTLFPKGHGAIATSWSHPESEYALQKKYANNMRGPVRFQLDLDKKMRGTRSSHG